MFAPWTVALIAVALAAWGLLAGRDSGEEHRRVVARIPPPEGTVFLVSSGLAISPDGSRVVFGARDGAETEMLWMQSLEDGTSRPLVGTENGKHPFWSPDGDAVGFFADSKLKKLTLGNGVVETLAAAPGRVGGTWNRHGVIVATRRDDLFRVPAGGGEEEVLSTESGQNFEYLFPSFLPDGNHFLHLVRNYSSESGKNELRVGSLDGEPSTVVMFCNSNAVYAPSGDLLWWQDGHLRAQPFDLDRFELIGESRLLQPDVQFDPRVGLGMFSVSSDGTLVIRNGGIVAGDELARVDREGRDLGAIGVPGNFYHPRFSPDGALVAVDQSDEANRGDIWIYDIGRGSGTRLTSAPQDESLPVWSPDGRQIAFSSTREFKSVAVHIRSLSGGDDERVLFGDPAMFAQPWSWSAAGFIVVEHSGAAEATVDDLGVFSVGDETFSPLIATEFLEQHGTISPDGRLVAYVSDETGRSEVYVQTFPDFVDRRRVSTDGGGGPVWRRDGRELYYVNDDSSLMAVPVGAAGDRASIQIGTPEALFTADFKGGSARQPFDTIDGQIFLINRSVGDYESAPLTLVLNAF